MNASWTNNKSRQRVLVATICAGLVAFVVGYFTRSALAEGIPDTEALTYSGMLYESGEPVTDDKTLVIKLWDAATGGNELCITSAADVPVDEGRFRVALDDTCTDAVSANPDTWVEVSVGTETLPRTKLGAVPYAVEADHAVEASHATSSSTSATLDDCAAGSSALFLWDGGVWGCSDAITIDGDGNVGIGTDAPGEALTVEGNVSATELFGKGTIREYTTTVTTDEDWTNSVTLVVLNLPDEAIVGTKINPGQGVRVATYQGYVNWGANPSFISPPFHTTVVGQYRAEGVPDGSSFVHWPVVIVHAVRNGGSSSTSLGITAYYVD